MSERGGRKDKGSYFLENRILGDRSGRDGKNERDGTKWKGREM